MADSKKYDGSQWEHSLRKQTTASEIIVPPTTIYCDGSNITTYSIKGNTVQNGTPTPSNPVDVNGVGEIDNIFEGNVEQGGYFSGDPYTAQNRVRSDTMILVQPNVQYHMNFTGLADQFTIVQYTTNGTFVKDIGSYFDVGSPFVFSSTWKVKFVFRNSGNTNISPSDVSNISLSRGYKIPILSGGATTNVYLGSTQTVRAIKKLVFDGTENWRAAPASSGYRFSIGINDAVQSDTTVGIKSYCSHFQIVGTGATYISTNSYVISGDLAFICRIDSSYTLETFKQWLAAQYANGTPVTIWYVSVTPETAAVNEPLMKIGDYVDTLSNATAIPTTEGANTITVDTTVQPSEFTATWTGWHDASVKEKSENLWNEEYIGISSGSGVTYLPIYVGSGNFTLSTTTRKTESSIQSQNGNANIFFLTGNVSSGAYTSGNGVWNEQNRTVTATDGYVTIAYRYLEGDSGSDPRNNNTMLNTGSTALPYEPYWK